MDISTKAISKIFSQDHKDKIVHILLSAIKRQNKHYFVNTILKAYFEESKKDLSSAKYLNNYIFNNIVQNEENWENYALAMLVGFL
jgi:dihydroorotate dehydrogenase